jgi:hypothetical protein
MKARRDLFRNVGEFSSTLAIWIAFLHSVLSPRELSSSSPASPVLFTRSSRRQSRRHRCESFAKGRLRARTLIKNVVGWWNCKLMHCINIHPLKTKGKSINGCIDDATWIFALIRPIRAAAEPIFDRKQSQRSFGSLSRFAFSYHQTSTPITPCGFCFRSPGTPDRLCSTVDYSLRVGENAPLPKHNERILPLPRLPIK